jgi:hypothetical protein
MESSLKKKLVGSDRFHDALTIAQQAGLLRGVKTEVVRGRMPKALVQKAKATSGARSDTELIEMALTNLGRGRLGIQTSCCRRRVP